MSFNPNNPLSLGPEWFPNNYGSTLLSGATDTVGLVVDSAATETISNLIIPHTWAGSSGYGKLFAEIYNLADLGEAQTEQTLTLYPNEDKTSNKTANQSGGTTNLYQAVDDTSPGSSDSDYIGAGGSGSGNPYVGFQFDTSTLPAGCRPVAVYFDLRAQFPYAGFGFVFGSVNTDVNWFNNTTDKGKVGTFPTGSLGINVWTDFTLGPFYIDPNLNSPWTRKGILDLDDNTKVNVRLTSATTTWGSLIISRFVMRVVYVAAEKRLAVGGTAVQTSPPAGLQTNLSMALTKPLDGAANWAKTSGIDYLVLLRRLDSPVVIGGSTLTPSVPFIEATANNPHGQGLSRTVALLSSNGQLLSVSGTNLPKTYPISMDVGGAFAADSQPYHSLTPKPVYTGQNGKQGIIDASAGQLYRQVRTLVAVATGFTPTANLEFRIKRLSDDVQFGGVGTLTTAQLGTAVLTKDGYNFYDVTVTLSSDATLAAATTYYIEYSTTTAQANAWYIPMLDATETNALTGNVTYGGSTAVATSEGAAQQGDFASVLSSVPDVLTGLGVVADSEPLPDFGDGCCDGCVRCFLVPSWDLSLVNEAQFSYYEIQRADAQAGPWASIGRVTDIDVDFFEDVEARRCRHQWYRVRQVRVDNVASAWTDGVAAICPCTDSDDVVYLTSNIAPAVSTGFTRLNPDHRYEFLSAADVKLLKLHNRDYQAEFRPLENRGVRFALSVLIYVEAGSTPRAAPPDGAGVQGFDTIRDLVENTSIAYVCVLTSDGERFFGSLALPEGLRSEPGANYVANMVFTQTTATPTVATRP